MEMDKKSLIRLTVELYQITILFPKKEPLRYKLRELADEILDDFIRIEKESNFSTGSMDELDHLLDGLEVMDGFFAVAKDQNWVVSDKLLPVWEEYNNIKESLGKVDEAKALKEDIENKQAILQDAIIDSPNRATNGVNDRQQKILEAIKQRGKVQVGEFKTVFPTVTKRTLRRDFWHLTQMGEIEKMGERNDTYYQLISRT